MASEEGTKIQGPKNYGSKRMLGPKKKCWVNVDLKKMLGPKKGWFQKSAGSKKMMVLIKRRWVKKTS